MQIGGLAAPPHAVAPAPHPACCGNAICCGNATTPTRRSRRRMLPQQDFRSGFSFRIFAAAGASAFIRIFDQDFRSRFSSVRLSGSLLRKRIFGRLLLLLQMRDFLLAARRGSRAGGRTQQRRPVLAAPLLLYLVCSKYSSFCSTLVWNHQRSSSWLILHRRASYMMRWWARAA